MKYLTATIGKGLKQLLKCGIVKDDEGKVVKTINDKVELETELINQNKKHYRKVFQTKVYKDRIYSKLLNDNICNRILYRTLTRDECSDNDIFEFLTLL